MADACGHADTAVRWQECQPGDQFLPMAGVGLSRPRLAAASPALGPGDGGAGSRPRTGSPALAAASAAARDAGRRARRHRRRAPPAPRRRRARPPRRSGRRARPTPGPESGKTPRKSVVWSDITRPRRWPGASVWSSVLVAAMVHDEAAAERHQERQRQRQRGGAREREQQHAERGTGDHQPALEPGDPRAHRDGEGGRPWRREPTAAWSDENVCGPPPSWRLANEGSSTEYGMPTTAKKASPPRMALSAGSRRTCARPSRMSANTDEVTRCAWPDAAAASRPGRPGSRGRRPRWR